MPLPAPAEQMRWQIDPDAARFDGALGDRRSSNGDVIALADVRHSDETIPKDWNAFRGLNTHTIVSDAKNELAWVFCSHNAAHKH
jgi:hypothetical protein